MKYHKVVYISHPYSGIKENRLKIEGIIKELIQKHHGYLFLSPVHSFGYLYNSVDYDAGIEYCLWLLGKSDEMWVFGDYKKSRGCLIEIKYCDECDIKYEIKGEAEKI